MNALPPSPPFPPLPLPLASPPTETAWCRGRRVGVSVAAVALASRYRRLRLHPHRRRPTAFRLRRGCSRRRRRVLQSRWTRHPLRSRLRCPSRPRRCLPSWCWSSSLPHRLRRSDSRIRCSSPNSFASTCSNSCSCCCPSSLPTRRSAGLWRPACSCSRLDVVAECGRDKRQREKCDSCQQGRAQLAHVISLLFCHHDRWLCRPSWKRVLPQAHHVSSTERSPPSGRVREAEKPCCVIALWIGSPPHAIRPRKAAAGTCDRYPCQPAASPELPLLPLSPLIAANRLLRADREWVSDRAT